jgi:hypothetical protein
VCAASSAVPRHQLCRVISFSARIPALEGRVWVVEGRAATVEGRVWGSVGGDEPPGRCRW